MDLRTQLQDRPTLSRLQMIMHDKPRRRRSQRVSGNFAVPYPYRE